MTNKKPLIELPGDNLVDSLGVTIENLNLINNIIKKAVEAKKPGTISQDLISIYNQLETAPDIIFAAYCYGISMARKRILCKTEKLLNTLL